MILSDIKTVHILLTCAMMICAFAVYFELKFESICQANTKKIIWLQKIIKDKEKALSEIKKQIPVGKVVSEDVYLKDLQEQFKKQRAHRLDVEYEISCLEKKKKEIMYDQKNIDKKIAPLRGTENSVSAEKKQIGLGNPEVFRYSPFYGTKKRK